MNILLVEHHPVERSGLADQIRALDHQVTVCDTASAALESYQQTFYPLILLHLELPDLEFSKFCHQIRALKQGECSMIVIMADQDQPENIQAAIAAGADDYLTQPVKQELLQARLTIIERQLKLKQALDALKLSQTYAGNIIESSLDMIIAVDHERRIVEFNKAAQENFGYRLEEVLGKHINMLYAYETESITTSRTTIEQGRYVREIFNKRKNGEIFPCLLSASILRDVQGNQVGVMGISRDITERKRVEEALKKAHTELEQQNVELARASRLKDEFLSMMSHELRTPLTTILCQSELLQEGIYGTLDDKQLSTIKSISQSCHQLSALIDDILDFSRLSQGKLKLNIAPIAVVTICQASLQAIQQQAQEKQLQISSNVDRNVTHIQADERRLKQVLLNLLQNAVKFTYEGGKIGLEVHGDPEQRLVHFTVWDTGIGIAPTDLGRLFQPFEQLNSGLAREYVGAGLGLSMVGRLVKLHNGQISVASEVGKGSRFTVSLPWNEK